MGCDFSDVRTTSVFQKFTTQKDGLDVYLYRSYDHIFFQELALYCPLCKNKFPEKVMNEIKSFNRKGIISFKFELGRLEQQYKDSGKIREQFEKSIKEEEKYLKTIYYKYKCDKTGQEIYLWLYPEGYTYYTFEKYISSDSSIDLSLRDLNYINYRDNYANREKITSDGYYKGKKLCGRVMVVDSYEDFKVQVVTSYPYPDLRVQKVNYIPSQIGQWLFVESNPDFKIRYVDSYPDFKIEFVDYNPGVF